ncbi:DUF4247 domain-containing protein [Terribacillus sp. 7520-G]|uniref:DUF4247 domain-containing protein n=1 Tax=Terribacillus sp. 7520-G TaxID=2025389 RepID=UPI000BA5A8B8|nr:DUF4247 domain-containing protein [Terribacillus sp. 7520-G]PAD40358.1 hypothetical protein CHH53_01530 [Terribacillus sp. 7520-G]
MKYWLAGICLCFVLILAGCGSSGDQSASVSDIPDEPDKETVTSEFENSAGESIETLIDNNFYLLDVVSGDRSTSANVYATRLYSVDELEELFKQTEGPDEISDKKNGQQIMIYDDVFITLKPSEEDDDVTLIEVADRNFVRENYSPNYLNTFFTFALLNSLFGSNWSQTRMDTCQNGGCYGGYTSTYRSDDGSGGTGSTVRRGTSSYRGGGPDAGK